MIAQSRLNLPNDHDAGGRGLGVAELTNIVRAFESGTLSGAHGTFVQRFEECVAALLDVRHAIACASGTTAIHAALAALDLEPGDEIVTTTITDLGAITPILYQGAIPVFADVDPHSLNVTAATIEAVLSKRTRAIIVTHLFGNPADVSAIRAVADPPGIPVIEDCAQAWLALHRGRAVGTFGAIGCFSLEQSKHITCGEGGVVATDDDALARRLRSFVNKGRNLDDPDGDHAFLGLNGRLSELQDAVALAQAEKLPEFIAIRRARARELDAGVAHIPDLGSPQTAAGDAHAYWRYALRIGSAIVGGPVSFANALRSFGVPTWPGYIRKPAFEQGVIARQRTFGESRWPFVLARPQTLDYRRERFAGTYDGLEHVLVLPLNERYTEQHVAGLLDALRTVREELAA